MASPLHPVHEPDLLGRVAVIAGGLSHERQVSLDSGQRLTRALRSLEIDVEMYDADPALAGALRGKNGCDVAVPMLLGGIGEDGSLQAALELLEVPFVGSPSSTCRASWDKSVCRAALAGLGFSVPDSVTLPIRSFRELGARELVEGIARRISPPYVVKPTQSGSALGIQSATDVTELRQAIASCSAYGDIVLIEPYFEGFDVAVGVYEYDGVATALPPVCITYAPSCRLDYAARYTYGLSTMTTQLPAGLAELDVELQQTAVQAHTKMRFRDWSRSDFVVRDDGSFVLLEIAITPALTDLSPYPAGLDAANTSVGPAVASLLDSVRRRTAGLTR